MNLQQRITAFANLGDNLQKKLASEELNDIIALAYARNAWFSPENSRRALKAIAANYLDRERLEKWVAGYQIPDENVEQTIAIVMAGNIPLAGFHDLLAVLISGSRAMIKESGKDEALMDLMISELQAIAPELAGRVEVAERLKDFDKVIATGSNNTRRYFEYYFGKHPHIIRHNRNSVAILTGNETLSDLRLLGEDILNYFGLGCRNVSKVYVPQGYAFITFLECIQDMAEVMDHHKYQNNYLYHKSILLLNREKHLDNNFLLIKEGEPIASPMSTLNFSYYTELAEVAQQIDKNRENIQVIVGQEGVHPAAIPFGTSQMPELWDYADNVDTLEFILK